VTATGPWGGQLRKLGADIARMGPAAGASTILKLRNYPGATGVLNPAANGSAAAYTITGSFHTGRFRSDANIFALANGLRLLDISGDGPMGPLNNTSLTDSDETPCYSARQIEDVSVELLNGEHLEQVPADMHVKTANLSYDTHWSVAGSNVSVHREFSSTIDQPICSGQIRKDTAAALARIRVDRRTSTILAPSAKTPAQAVAAPQNASQ